MQVHPKRVLMRRKETMPATTPAYRFTILAHMAGTPFPYGADSPGGRWLRNVAVEAAELRQNARANPDINLSRRVAWLVEDLIDDAKRAEKWQAFSDLALFNRASVIPGWTLNQIIDDALGAVTETLIWAVLNQPA